MFIKPSTAIRNDYAGISALAHAEDTPIVLTKNGESDLVVISYEAFERREEVLRLKARLEAAEQVRLSGQRGLTLDEARARLEEIYG